MKNSDKAFTLIELLVVIAIIGILSSVVLASLSGARSSARDAQRIQAVDQMRTALEMYYNDHGEYPGQPETDYYTFSETSNLCSNDGRWCGDFANELSPYIDNLPEAKTFSDEEYLYKNNTQSDMYGLWVKLEEPTEASRNDGGYYDDRYEVGQLPSYCMNKYTGSDRRWDYWSSGNDCYGGN